MTTNREAAAAFFEAVPYEIPVPLPIANMSDAAMLEMTPDGSSPYWIARLTTELDKRAPRLTKLRQYHRGEQDTWKLHGADAKLAFGKTFSTLKSNLAAPIVSAVKQRLRVESFRIPAEPGQAGASDTAAWAIWQANNLDGRSSVAHTEALAMGECPVIVARSDDGRALITVEDPMQVVVARDPADPQHRLAALKRWSEPDGSTVVVLYLPDRVEWWRSSKTARAGYRTQGPASFDLRGRRWSLDAARSGVPPVEGEVPVVPLVNRPRVDGSGEAEHEAVIPLLDALNKTLLDMLTTSEFTAFPQRTAVGISLDDEDDDDPDGVSGDAARPSTQAGPGRIWSSENPDAKFGQLDAASLSPYTDAIATLVEQIGTVSGTPYHLLLNAPTSVPATGEALKSAERSLDGKAEDAQTWFGEAWEEIMRLAFLVEGQGDRAGSGSEVNWRKPSTSSEAQHADALVKLLSIGVDEETLWELYPFSPEQIIRIKARREVATVQEAVVEGGVEAVA